MKKILFQFLFIAIFFSSVTGGTAADVKSKDVSKDLVVYYSLTGKTMKVAKTLAREIGADTLKIEDAEPLSAQSLRNKETFNSMRNSAWPIKHSKTGLARYKRIFIGTPLWWGEAAPKIFTFINKTDFSGKSVVIFITMGGSDPTEALNKLSREITAKGGNVISVFSISTGDKNDKEIETAAKQAAQQYKK